MNFEIPWTAIVSDIIGAAVRRSDELRRVSSGGVADYKRAALLDLELVDAVDALQKASLSHVIVSWSNLSIPHDEREAEARLADLIKRGSLGVDGAGHLAKRLILWGYVKQLESAISMGITGERLINCSGVAQEKYPGLELQTALATHLDELQCKLLNEVMPASA